MDSYKESFNICGFFLIVGTAKFLERILTGISETLTVSKIGRVKFRLTGLDIYK